MPMSEQQTHEQSDRGTKGIHHQPAQSTPEQKRWAAGPQLCPSEQCMHCSAIRFLGPIKAGR